MKTQVLFDAKGAVLALNIAAEQRQSNIDVIRCCNRLLKLTHKSIHPHLKLIKSAKHPVDVVRRTWQEFKRLEKIPAYH